MASRGWGKNKKGVLVNSQGKTSLEIRLDKYATKLKARKEKLAAKKAEAKASAKAKVSGGGGSGEKGTAKPANKGSEEKLNEIASQYGWSVKDGVLYTSKGNFMHSVTEKKGRIHLRNKDGQLRGTLSSPEKLGWYLEKTFYAEKRKPEAPAKPASKGSEEKIATQKTKKPSDMSAREMQKEYQQIDDKQAKLTDKLIEAGFSRVTMSEISRRRNENPLFKEYAELSDRAKELTLEAEIRGGPGFRVRDLTSKHKNPYAKKPNKKISNRGD